VIKQSNYLNKTACVFHLFTGVVLWGAHWVGFSNGQNVQRGTPICYTTVTRAKNLLINSLIFFNFRNMEKPAFKPLGAGIIG
jgi:hypothetical protein